MLDFQPLLVGELRPEARRENNRPCGLVHVVLLVASGGAPAGAIGSGLYAVADRRVK